jgi:RNA polymerase sigma factor (sigma-70 family)
MSTPLLEQLPKYKDGLRISDPRDYSAEEVVAQYIRVIHRQANQWCQGNYDLYEDLVSEGVLGILRAIDFFDPAKANENSFHQLACFQFRGRMFKMLESELHRPFSVPMNYFRPHRHLRKLRDWIGQYQEGEAADYTLRNYESPEFDSVAPERIRRKVKRSKDLLTRSHGQTSTYEYAVRSLIENETAMNAHKCDLGQEHPTPDLEEQVNARREIARIFDAVSERDREMLRLRFVEDQTLDEVGQSIYPESNKGRAAVSERIKALQGRNFGPPGPRGSKRKKWVPIHEADRQTILAMLEDPGVSNQKQIADKIGRSVSYVSNRIQELRGSGDCKP